jgi:hypothetical protein
VAGAGVREESETLATSPSWRWAVGLRSETGAWLALMLTEHVVRA